MGQRTKEQKQIIRLVNLAETSIQFTYSIKMVQELHIDTHLKTKIHN